MTNEQIILGAMRRGQRYTTTELRKLTGVKKTATYLAKARMKSPPLVRRYGDRGSHEWVKY